MITFNLEKSWKKALGSELDQDYIKSLRSFISQELKEGKEIYPDPALFFEAFKQTPVDQVKVVILGQDPYHGDGQAHGLSFSVQKGVRVPPSLRNIYKELETDMGMTIPDHGYLQSWSQQGVLLLNSTLSVEKGKPASHQKKGWEKFTDKVIEVLSDQHEGIVFMLWGSPAGKKGARVDREKHLVLKAPHPSPLSSYRGFFGCQHFSKANSYLEKAGKTAIDWTIC